MRFGAENLVSRVEMAGAGVATMLSRLPLSWRGAGALVIGVMLARWTWILFAPHTLAVFPAQSDVGGNASEMLFGVPAANAGAATNANAKLGNVQLLGVFTGKHGFAVLKLDEKTQRGVALGEEVIKGTRLVEIDPDHIVLEQDGVRQQVNLEIKAVKNKDNLAMQQNASVSGVAQAMAGWNQANQALQNERSQQRTAKMKEAHK